MKTMLRIFTLLLAIAAMHFVEKPARKAILRRPVAAPLTGVNRSVLP